MNQQLPPVTPVPTAKKGRGCFFYGCITLVVAGVIVTALLVGGAYFGIQKVKDTIINEYTSTQGVKLPAVTLPEQETEALKARIDSFVQNPSTPLTITVRELNGLIAADPNFAEIQGRVYLSTVGDHFRGEISYPLDEFGVEGRYFNGFAEFSVNVSNGALFVQLQKISVNDASPPDAFMDSLQRENLAKDFKPTPEQTRILAAISNISVKGDSIVITGKGLTP